MLSKEARGFKTNWKPRSSSEPSNEEFHSDFQCGGCFAVLRASNKHTESGVSSEKSGDEMKNMSLVSESGVKSNGSSGRRQEIDDGSNINFEEPKPQIPTAEAAHEDQFEP
ncbi:hypothetical protein LXL04_039152 [Taraxacum kok-saghyz]